MKELELLHEGFKRELDELESFKQRVGEFTLKAKRYKVADELAIIISNLEGLCDSLYSEYENSNQGEYEELKVKYEVVHMLLSNLTDHEDKTYIRLKYGIDF